MISTNQSGQSFPGLTLKAWAYVKGDGTLLKSFNVASSSRGGVGTYTVNYTAAMSSAAALAKIQANQWGATKAYYANRTNQIAAGINVSTFNDAGAATDNDFYVEVWE